MKTIENMTEKERDEHFVQETTDSPGEVWTPYTRPDGTIRLHRVVCGRVEDYICPDYETSKAVARRLSGTEGFVSAAKTKKFKVAVDKVLSAHMT